MMYFRSVHVHDEHENDVNVYVHAHEVDAYVLYICDVHDALLLIGINNM